MHFIEELVWLEKRGNTRGISAKVRAENGPATARLSLLKLHSEAKWSQVPKRFHTYLSLTIHASTILTCFGVCSRLCNPTYWEDKFWH